ncbi:hypothetical protein FRB95_006594 [Tulasnella sp. JGI-2019a]|nr:hypothetical protein FRB95_006594 [Tulasnella sp. JGI-2019a]
MATLAMKTAFVLECKIPSAADFISSTTQELLATGTASPTSPTNPRSPLSGRCLPPARPRPTSPLPALPSSPPKSVGTSCSVHPSRPSTAPSCARPLTYPLSPTLPSRSTWDSNRTSAFVRPLSSSPTSPPSSFHKIASVPSPAPIVSVSAPIPYSTLQHPDGYGSLNLYRITPDKPLPQPDDHSKDELSELAERLRMSRPSQTNMRQQRPSTPKKGWFGLRRESNASKEHGLSGDVVADGVTSSMGSTRAGSVDSNASLFTKQTSFDISLEDDDGAMDLTAALAALTRAVDRTTPTPTPTTRADPQMEAVLGTTLDRTQCNLTIPANSPPPKLASVEARSEQAPMSAPPKPAPALLTKARRPSAPAILDPHTIAVAPMSKPTPAVLVNTIRRVPPPLISPLPPVLPPIMSTSSSATTLTPSDTPLSATSTFARMMAGDSRKSSISSVAASPTKETEIIGKAPFVPFPSSAPFTSSPPSNGLNTPGIEGRADPDKISMEIRDMKAGVGLGEPEVSTRNKVDATNGGKEFAETYSKTSGSKHVEVQVQDASQSASVEEALRDALKDAAAQRKTQIDAVADSIMKSALDKEVKKLKSFPSSSRPSTAATVKTVAFVTSPPRHTLGSRPNTSSGASTRTPSHSTLLLPPRIMSGRNMNNTAEEQFASAFRPQSSDSTSPQPKSKLKSKSKPRPTTPLSSLIPLFGFSPSTTSFGGRSKSRPTTPASSLIPSITFSTSTKESENKSRPTTPTTPITPTTPAPVPAIEFPATMPAATTAPRQRGPSYRKPSRPLTPAISFDADATRRLSPRGKVCLDWDREADPWRAASTEFDLDVFGGYVSDTAGGMGNSNTGRGYMSDGRVGLRSQPVNNRNTSRRPGTGGSSHAGYLSDADEYGESLRLANRRRRMRGAETDTEAVDMGQGSLRSKKILQRGGGTRRRMLSSSAGVPPSVVEIPSQPSASTSTSTSSNGKDAVKGMKSKPPVVRPPLPEDFRGDERLTMRELYDAASIKLYNQDGKKVTFGSLFEDQRTIIVFIRHFWCPMCQDYMRTVVKDVRPEQLERAGVKLVVIGCGDPGMIKAYNERIFKSPYPFYVDPHLRLYRALGMTLKTLDAGPDVERGEYVRHGAFVGTLSVIKRALMSGLPVIRKGGDIKQLGGEFVLGPGLRCRYAHRMSTTRDHADITHVARAAGVDTFDPFQAARSTENVTPTSEIPNPFVFKNQEEEEAWMSEREEGVKRLKAKKVARRGGDSMSMKNRDSFVLIPDTGYYSCDEHRCGASPISLSTPLGVSVIPEDENEVMKMLL